MGWIISVNIALLYITWSPALSINANGNIELLVMQHYWDEVFSELREWLVSSTSERIWLSLETKPCLIANLHSSAGSRSNRGDSWSVSPSDRINWHDRPSLSLLDSDQRIAVKFPDPRIWPPDHRNDMAYWSRVPDHVAWIFRSQTTSITGIGISPRITNEREAEWRYDRLKGRRLGDGGTGSTSGRDSEARIWESDIRRSCWSWSRPNPESDYCPHWVPEIRHSPWHSPTDRSHTTSTSSCTSVTPSYFFIWGSYCVPWTSTSDWTPWNSLKSQL
jgi:hypothetical protein